MLPRVKSVEMWLLGIVCARLALITLDPENSSGINYHSIEGVLEGFQMTRIIPREILEMKQFVLIDTLGMVEVRVRKRLAGDLKNIITPEVNIRRMDRLIDRGN